MRRAGEFLITALLILFSSAATAQNVRWFEIKSKNFLIITDTSEAKGRRLATDLESRVNALQSVIGTIPARQLPIEILLFKNKAYVELAPSRTSPRPYTS